MTLKILNIPRFHLIKIYSIPFFIHANIYILINYNQSSY